MVSNISEDARCLVQYVASSALSPLALIKQPQTSAPELLHRGTAAQSLCLLGLLLGLREALSCINLCAVWLS